MRNIITFAAVLSVFAAGASILAGCQNTSKTENEALCEKPKPGTIVTVNEYCAVNLNDPVDPNIVEVWNGQKVGFCCKGCLPKWAAMTAVEKDTAVAKAVAKGKIKS